LSKKRPRVLIVDDNDVMRMLLRGILREEAYEVVGEAKNGQAAIDMTERLLPDIVCLDVVMPYMDGLEALREIRQLHPESVVIMITGNASADNVREAVDLGATDFIVKPFNAAKVLGALARASERLH
jgi:two-component system, chemotaxis family, chemotaxis protein CheY